VKTFTKEELAKVLELHEMWLNGVEGGEKANLRYADLSYANLSNAYLINADLSKANLYKADLSDADLSYADLSNANLSNANLRSAHLYNANLYNANLQFTDIFCFTLGKHYAFFHTGDRYEDGNYLKIGCHGFSLKYWLDNYKKIGEKEGYSKEEIKRYGRIIKMLQKEIREKA